MRSGSYAFTETLYDVANNPSNITVTQIPKNLQNISNVSQKDENASENS